MCDWVHIMYAHICVYARVCAGVGVPPVVETPAVENAVISMEELMHFISWIFSPQQAMVLKQRGHDGERGRTHQLRDYAARTWPVYKKHAESEKVKGISRRNYNTMLKLPVFKRSYLCNYICVRDYAIYVNYPHSQVPNQKNVRVHNASAKDGRESKTLVSSC